jgi:hypothetical protein
VDHPAAFTHAADPNLTPAEKPAAAQINLHRERLADEVGGADRGRGAVRSLLGRLQVTREGRHRGHELIHLDPFADDPGGLEQNIGRLAPERLGDCRGGAHGIFHAELTGRRVSLTRVGEHRADRLRIAQDLAAVLNRRGGYSVLGEDSSDHRRFVRDDEAAVGLVLAGRAEFRLERGGFEALRGAHAAFDGFPRAGWHEVFDGGVGEDGELVGFVVHLL